MGRALSPLRSDRAACGVSSLSSDDRSRMRAWGPHEVTGDAGEDLRLRGKGRTAPSPPQRQFAGPWLGCASARTTPADSRCPPRPRLFATTAGPMAEAIALRR